MKNVKFASIAILFLGFLFISFGADAQRGRNNNNQNDQYNNRDDDRRDDRHDANRQNYRNNRGGNRNHYHQGRGNVCNSRSCVHTRPPMRRRVYCNRGRRPMRAVACRPLPPRPRVHIRF